MDRLPIEKYSPLSSSIEIEYEYDEQRKEWTKELFCLYNPGFPAAA